jgi:nucleoside-diphosphate-sugar epimerase
VGERQMTIGQSKLDAVEALEKSSLEYTLFYVGYFLDFWGYPRVKSYQRQNLIVVDIEYNRAAIPGDGNTPVTFTHTFDVAEFVAASLDLPSWEKESYVIGESVTWNEFLRLAEEVKGMPSRDPTIGPANPLS